MTVEPDGYRRGRVGDEDAERDHDAVSPPQPGSRTDVAGSGWTLAAGRVGE
jgi:hypothetical protein